MSEEWKQYPKFPFILVSNTGILISLKNPLKPKMLRQRFDKDGYLMVTIRDRNQKSYTLKAHRIVAETFLDNPMNLPLVNHKDEIKHHNNVNNLEWCDASYNRNYSKENNLIKIRLTHKVTKEVIEYRGLKSVAEEFNCIVPNVAYAIKVKEPKKGIFKDYKIECFA